MKKLFVSLCVAGLIVSSASSLFAGGIENKHNWSAEYVRTLNRNAATDSADAVVYNPAGVMKMEDGFYLNLRPVCTQRLFEYISWYRIRYR
ncbi:MAG: hypothetical protein JRF31_12510 [Deltaproteobacteria bacterium]|nr:hypothetical protein [Deltaproteobacteria bacterium]